MSRTIRATTLGLAGVIALCLVAAGCGGSSGAPVAELGSTPVSTTTARSGTGPSLSRSTELGDELAFARCMRSHGVPGFRDPNSDGQFPSQSSPSLQAKQATLAAQQICKHLLPAGSSLGTAADRAEKFAFARAVARCLRTHGYPDFPDPTATADGTTQRLGGADPGSPQFQSAQATCEKLARP